MQEFPRNIPAVRWN